MSWTVTVASAGRSPGVTLQMTSAMPCSSPGGLSPSGPGGALPPRLGFGTRAGGALNLASGSTPAGWGGSISRKWADETPFPPSKATEHANNTQGENDRYGGLAAPAT